MKRALAGLLAALPLCIHAVHAQALKVEVLADKLENPWGLAYLPDGRMLLTERVGRLTLRDAAGALISEIRNVPPAFVKLQEIGRAHV